MSHFRMSRRDLLAITSVGAGWPRIVSAQQPQPVRRIAILMQFGAEDPEGQQRVAAFVDALKQLGWSDGQNVQIDIRWGSEDPNLERRLAAELIALSPDVILSSGTVSTATMQEATRAVPIVFVNVADAVGAGFVDSLTHPGGNSTGFTNYEFSVAGKWLELLKKLAPSVNRVGVLRNPANSASIAMFAAMQIAASSLGVEVHPINARHASEIEDAIMAFARHPNGGMVGTAGVENVHRDLIVALAERCKLPAVYLLHSTVKAGGLAAYGPDRIDQVRRAAGYIDRILRGDRPGDLPVQSPTKFNLAINLQTAKALGLVIPAAILAGADEVIE